MDSAITLAKQGDSTIIVLLIVVAIIVLSFIPLIKTIAKISNTRRKQDYDREGRFIQVIEKNTEVNTALKSLIEADQKHCDSCRREQFNLFKKLFDNQETTNTKLNEISTEIKKNKGDQ